MNSLKQINYLINIAKNSKTGNYVILTLEGLKEIKKDLEVLEIFAKCISIYYIKNVISETEFSLNNFDWDIEDEKCLTSRIKELNILVEFLKAYEVGDSK